jgi:hypothetical protein
MSQPIYPSPNTRSRFWGRAAVALAIVGILQAGIGTANAQSKQKAPAALATMLAKIDAAASSRQLPELLRYYSPNFRSTDGLTKTDLQQSVGQLWQSYNNLRYTTTIDSWQGAGNNFTANTTTKISGTRDLSGRALNLQSTIRSQQKIVGGQVVQQQVLQERTLVSSGAKPPTIEINLPSTIATNTEFNLDAIVTEPLGEDVLMGTTIEQAVTPQAYTKPANYKLELLSAGGLFKVARAPGKSGDYWYSTIFIRPSGMTTLTQRVRVVSKK